MISVIINVYNGEKYIKKCLDSIINQTYKNLEIIIVNDGSTDNTLSICKGYKDKRIKIINQENMGAGLARNTGIDAAKGEYIYFIDSDDFIELDTLEYLYNLCSKYNTKIASCRSLDIYNYNLKKKQVKEKIDILSSKDMLKKIFTATDNTVAIWNKLIHKDLFENLRFENRVADDIPFTHKILMSTEKIVYSNQIKYYYLKHQDSICRKERENINRAIDMYDGAIERYYYVKKIYPNFIENNIGILELTIRLYLRNNPDIIKELNKRNAIKTYKKLFSLRIIISNLKYTTKIKLILFRISPKLYKSIINAYLKMKRNKK